MRNYKGKLRNKIFLFMALIGIVPLIVAAGLTDYVVTNSHRDDVAKLEAAVLTQTGSSIQSFINNDILTQTSVEIPYSGNIFSTSSIPAQEYVLSQTLGALSFLQSESYVNLQGQETSRSDRANLLGYPSSSLQNVATSPAFLTAKSGSDYLGPVSYPNGVPTVTFASPVKDNNGEIIGVISGIASLTDLQTIVASATVGNTGYLYLVDPNGAVIAGGGDAAAGGTFANSIGSSPSVTSSIVQKVIGGNSALTSASQARYKNAFGVEVVAAGEPLTENGQYWGLVAEWPASEADQVINALLLRDIIILLIVFGFVIGLSIILALIIVKPIQQLEEGTIRVAHGKFDEGVNIRTGDEIQELGDSFNDMVVGLKELEKLKDEFVFIAAHELRTPVSAMKGYLTLILEGSTGPVSEQTTLFIQKVLASNERLIQLVNDLLEVARSQAGRLTIKVSPVDVAPSITSTLEELKSLADQKSVTMMYVPLANSPLVLADVDRVKEVVINLVGNAIKYMGGSGTITITQEVVAGASAEVPSMLVTHITDTGLGISKEAQEKLFEKFYRVQTDKTREITGTGLGLFIVKEMVEKMNGTISVVSEEGHGSTFSFALRVAPQA